MMLLIKIFHTTASADIVRVNVTNQSCAFSTALDRFFKSKKFSLFFASVHIRQHMVHKLSLIAYWVNKYMTYLPISSGLLDIHSCDMQSFL